MQHRTPVYSVHALAMAAVLFASACADQSTAEPTGATRESIIGGTVDTGDNAVAYLDFEDGKGGGMSCTGTLIAPNVVLTAGHCSLVDETCNGGGGPPTCTANPASGYTVYGGTNPADNNFNIVAPTWKAKDLENHPNPNYGNKANGDAHDDVGILVLDTIQVMSGSAPTPVPWLSTKDNAIFVKGTTFRTVGFGLTNHQADIGAGTKRQVTTTIQSSDATTFQYGGPTANNCDGDSGGPALATINGVETLIGTTSGGDVNCVQVGIDMRVDAFAAFIGQFAAPSKPASPPKTAPSPAPTPTPMAPGGTQPAPAPTTCAHAPDTSGPALAPSCDPTVAGVCQGDGYCCKVRWDWICVDEAESAANP
jgi:V8-like Glu-specific endopeptidase